MHQQVTVSKPARRNDLHGLRGLAVLLVVVYHVFIGRVSGGVDVFLFLSAYFLTGTFVKRLSTRHAPKIFSYWGTVFKRLLPPAVAVILLTYAAVYFLLPTSFHMSALEDAIFALLQSENWWLIAQQTDYYALDRSSASPYQQFWSLAIQSQIFIIWPLLFLIVWVLLKLTTTKRHQPDVIKRRVYSLTFFVFGSVTLASFIWSVYFTAAAQQVAYFDTFSRAWEFGLGTLLALVPLQPTLTRETASSTRRLLHIALSFIGVALLVSMGIIIDVAGLFPGWIALWPLGAAALIILARCNPLLESRIFGFFGDISYALYLIHWPILVITVVLLGTPQADLLWSCLILCASLIFAWLITKFIDNPFRKISLQALKGWAAPSVIIGWLGAGLALLLSVQAFFIAEITARENQIVKDSSTHPGALVLRPDYQGLSAEENTAETLPRASDLNYEWWALPDNCERLSNIPEIVYDNCTSRVADADPQTKHVLYWGNSRLEQLAAGVDPLFESAGWNATAVLFGGCAPGVQEDEFCADITSQMLDFALQTKPDAVVMLTTYVPDVPYPRENVFRATHDVAHKLLDAGIQVIGMRDFVRMPMSLTLCLESYTFDQCSIDAKQQFMEPRADHVFIDSHPNIYGVDVNEQICPDEICVPIIGNIHVFLDTDHITKTYSRTLQTFIAEQLETQSFKW